MAGSATEMDIVQNGTATAGISFHGQTAIVTGAGRGLRRSYALELARRGASVIVNDIGLDPDTKVPWPETVAEEIRVPAASPSR